MEAAAAPSASEPSSGGVASLQPGRPLVGRFAVARKDRQQSKAGTPYLSLELRDRTGSIPARIFREADQLGARFERGDDPAEFLPSAYRSVEELEGFFEHLTGEVYDPALRALVEAVAASEPVATELRRAPCTRGGHHAYLGGLLEHTVSVGTMVGDLCQLHPKLDSDLLMAAALLHDIGKTREFTYGAEFGISEEGALLGHLQLAAEIINATPQAAALPAERRLALLHCVLSHHGPEAAGRTRGNASGFASAEALALARLNSLDASVKDALEHGLR